MCVHATVIITARMDPLFNGFFFLKARVNPPELGFFAGCMFTRGKESMRRLMSWLGKTPMLLLP
jgi:hypothetical protein